MLLDKLFDKYHVAIVGFDVLFPEHDEISGLRLPERLGERDLHATSVHPVYPSMEVDAYLMPGILDNTLVQKPLFLVGANILPPLVWVSIVDARAWAIWVQESALRKP